MALAEFENNVKVKCGDYNWTANVFHHISFLLMFMCIFNFSSFEIELL